jgi:signal transduction histidine kinase
MTLSLESKIRIVFFFTFLLLLAALFFVDRSPLLNNKKQLRFYYQTLASYIHENRLPPYEIVDYLKDKGFEEVENPRQILHNTKPVFHQRGFALLTLNNRFYFHIRTPHFKMLFVDKVNKKEQSVIHFIVFGIVVLLLGFIYYLIMKNIKERNLLLSSRQLFLRTVMHELKTPIAKGRIVSELLDEEKQRNRLVEIFDKLGVLIDDFAKVEQVVSNNYQTHKTQHTTSSLIRDSIDMLMLEDTRNIEIENSEPQTINVDRELFAMAMKNLIDNGLKYSKDKKVLIQSDTDRVSIISTGQALSFPLEHYYKPFHNDTSNKNHGMGLGLYIVYSIVSIHGMRLEYRYEDGKNIFTILF